MPRPLCDGVRAVPGPARKVSSPAFSRLRNGVRADSGALAEDCALCPRGWGGADGGSGRRAPEVAVLSLGVAAISGTSDPLSPAACCAGYLGFERGGRPKKQVWARRPILGSHPIVDHQVSACYFFSGERC